MTPSYLFQTVPATKTLGDLVVFGVNEFLCGDPKQDHIGIVLHRLYASVAVVNVSGQKYDATGGGGDISGGVLRRSGILELSRNEMNSKKVHTSAVNNTR
jgi:hypothetical protein